MTRDRLPLVSFLALTLAGVAGCADDDGTGPEGPGGSPDGGPSMAEPTPLDPGSVGELLVPFDADRQDLVGPADHGTQYGRRPSIVVRPADDAIDVLAQDDGEPPQPRSVLMRLVPDGEGYEIAAALEVPILDRLMGFARDDAGHYYVASGIDEGDDLTPDHPAVGEYRQDIVRVQKLDADGQVLFDTDLDVARAMATDNPEQVINPMVAASARLAVGGGAVALVHGNNTEPDWDIDGARHQKALTTHLDADTGAVTRTSSIWVSHSFDQRLFYDGQGFIEVHLGDAFPRWMVMARVGPGSGNSGAYPLFFNKGQTGNNNTYGRLGDVAPIQGDPSFGYLAVLATERTTDTTPLFDAQGEERVAGVRDLAVVRVLRDFQEVGGDDRDDLVHLDPDLPHALTVTSGGAQRTNRLRWLTDYDGLEATVHVERPKLVAVGDDRFIALWETWERTDEGRNAYEHTGTHGMLLDAAGEPLAGPAHLTDHHLPRGDDAFAVDGQAAWMIGDREQRILRLHLVDDGLDYRQVVIE